MNRNSKTANYEETLNLKVRLKDVLPPDHLARFIVDIIAQLDLDLIYQQYSDEGAPPYAPEILLGLLFYGYATGVFSSRKIERATHESIPFRFHRRQHAAGSRHHCHVSQTVFERNPGAVCANPVDRARNG